MAGLEHLKHYHIGKILNHTLSRTASSELSKVEGVIIYSKYAAVLQHSSIRTQLDVHGDGDGRRRGRKGKGSYRYFFFHTSKFEVWKKKYRYDPSGFEVRSVEKEVPV